MRPVFIAVIAFAAAGLLVIGLGAKWFIQDQTELARARGRLEAPAGGDRSADDQDAGVDGTEAQRWDVALGDGFAVSSIEVLGDKEAFIFTTPGSEARIIVMVMAPDVEAPAMEFITGAWTDAQRRGATVDPIEMLSYGEHAWIGYSFRAEQDGEQVAGMAYASIDTSSRGVQLFIGGLWSSADDESARKALLRALEQVAVTPHR